MKFVKKKMNLTKVALIMSLSSFFDFVQKWDLHDEDYKKKGESAFLRFISALI